MPVLAWSTFNPRGTVQVIRSQGQAPDAIIQPPAPRNAIALQLNGVGPQPSTEVPIAWFCPVLFTSGTGSAPLLVVANQSPLMSGQRVLFTRASLGLATIDPTGSPGFDIGFAVWLIKFARVATLEWWDR